MRKKCASTETNMTTEIQKNSNGWNVLMQILSPLLIYALFQCTIDHQSVIAGVKGFTKGATNSY